MHPPLNAPIHRQSNRPLLVLDLDETLCLVQTSQPSHIPTCTVFTFWGRLHIHARPGLPLFLQALRPHFDIAIWSASPEERLEVIVSALFPDFPLLFVWGLTRCAPQETPLGHFLAKPLSALRPMGWQHGDAVLLDDQSLQGHVNPRTWVGIQSYTQPNSQDTEMIRVLPLVQAHLARPATARSA